MTSSWTLPSSLQFSRNIHMFCPVCKIGLKLISVSKEFPNINWIDYDQHWSIWQLQMPWHVVFPHQTRYVSGVIPHCIYMALVGNQWHISDRTFELIQIWRILQGLYSLSGKTSYRQISWSLEAARLSVINDRFALKFDRHLGSVAAEVPVKFQSNWKSLNLNLATSRLHEILR